MSFLEKINHTSPVRSADDFNCGWSVMFMLAGLSASADEPDPAGQDCAGRGREMAVHPRRQARPVAAKSA